MSKIKNQLQFSNNYNLMKKKNNGLLKKIKLFFFSILDFSSKELQKKMEE